MFNSHTLYGVTGTHNYSLSLTVYETVSIRIAGVLGADGVNATGEASFCSVVSEIQN